MSTPSCPSLISWNEKPTEMNSRAILVASVEDHEGVRLSKEVLFIQFVGTELHGGVILQTEEKTQESEKWKDKKSRGHCKSMLLPLFASCCLFIHAVCQDIKALKHRIKAKCWLNPNKSRVKPASGLLFSKPANAFITISLLCNSCITTVDGIRDIKLKIPWI